MRRGIALALVTRLLLGLAGIVLVLYVLMRGYAAALSVPSFASVKQQSASSYVTILDRQGHILEQLRENFVERRVDWFVLEDFSPELIQAVQDSEDRRFFSHWGVDYLALFQASFDHLRGKAQRGASTISMQLVGLLMDSNKQGRRGYGQKLQQIIYAQSLEMAWSKEEILEAYLNLVPLKGETIGVPSASRTYFQKFPSGLNQAESAIIAAMLRAPNASPERLTQRACALLEYRHGSCQFLARVIDNALRNPQVSMPADIHLAPHFARRYLALKGQQTPLAGQALQTSIYRPLQAFVVQRVQQRLQELFANQVQDAAVVVLHNQTGEILAYIGSSGQLTAALHVDHAQALRQAGSTLKPFLYAQAIDEQRITAASLLNDALLNLSEQTGLYVPQNYDRHFRGWVSVRTALASSLNIPAVRLMTMVGAESFWRVLKQLGLPLNQDAEFYGYSLALGSADIDLLSLTNAFRALANQGVYSPVQWFLSDSALVQESGAPTNEPARVQESDALTNEPTRIQEADALVHNSGQMLEDTTIGAQRVFSAEASWIVGNILADRQARAITFGLDSALSTPFWSAVKTGTSKDMRDNWTVGWSSTYTVGVWVGNSSGASMRDITGVSGAGPIWHDVMQYLHKEHASFAPTRPPRIVEQEVHFQENLEPKRLEYFLPGTQMSEVRLADTLQVQSRLFIETPADNMIIALDPDIPMSQQKVLLQAKQLGGSVQQPLWWRVNGEKVSADNPYALAILPGRYTIELMQEAEQVLDTVSLQVRGARLKSTAEEKSADEKFTDDVGAE